MSTLVLTPQNKSELDLLIALLKRMQISVAIIDEEERGNLGLSLLMKEADRSDKVSRESIIAKLGSDLKVRMEIDSKYSESIAILTFKSLLSFEANSPATA